MLAQHSGLLPVLADQKIIILHAAHAGSTWRHMACPLPCAHATHASRRLSSCHHIVWLIILTLAESTAVPEADDACSLVPVLKVCKEASPCFLGNQVNSIRSPLGHQGCMHAVPWQLNRRHSYLQVISMCTLCTLSTDFHASTHSYKSGPPHHHLMCRGKPTTGAKVVS